MANSNDNSNYHLAEISIPSHLCPPSPGRSYHPNVHSKKRKNRKQEMKEGNIRSQPLEATWSGSNAREPRAGFHEDTWSVSKVDQSRHMMAATSMTVQVNWPVPFVVQPRGSGFLDPPDTTAGVVGPGALVTVPTG